MMQKNQGMTISRLSLILTIAAIGLWSYSIFQARLVIDDFGLLHSFPITYFIAIAVITVAFFILWRSRDRNNGLLFLQLFIIIASLLLVPILIGGQHRGGSYWNSGEVDYILQQGHLNPKEMWYHQYPIAWIFAAISIKLFGIETLDLFDKLVPFFCQLVYFPVIYVFLKNIVGREKDHYVWVGIWLFYLAEWLGFSGLSPQTFGWFFFIVLLALFSTDWQHGLQSASSRLSTIITYTGLIMSHWLSSIYSFAGVAMLLFRKKIKVSMVILLGLGIAVWTVFSATTFFQGHLREFISHAFRIDEIWKSGLVERISSPNPAHGFLDMVRSWYTLVFLGIGFLGLILGLTDRKERNTVLTIFVMATGIVGAAIVIAFSYRHEIIDKTYLFGIPLIAYFATRLLKYKLTTIIICLLLLAAPLPYIASHYANALTDHTSPATMAGLRFFEDNGANYGSLTGNYHNWGGLSYAEAIIPYYEYPPDKYVIRNDFLSDLEQYQGILYEELKLENNRVYTTNPDVIYPHYISISQRDKGIYYWIWNRLEYINQIETSLNNASNCNLVYTNPDFKLWLIETSAE